MNRTERHRRTLWALLAASVATVVGAAPGCSSDSGRDASGGVTCGTGTVLSGGQCVAPCGPGTVMAEGQCVIADASAGGGGDSGDRDGTAGMDAMGGSAGEDASPGSGGAGGVDGGEDAAQGDGDAESNDDAAEDVGPGGAAGTGGADAASDADAADAEADAALADDPCPTKPLAVDCSAQCGQPAPGACFSHACTDLAGVAFSSLANVMIARTPSHPGTAPLCADACAPGSTVYSMTLEWQGAKPGVSLRVRVGAPWTIQEGWSSWCVDAAKTECLVEPEAAQRFQIVTTDPNAPARNVTIERFDPIYTQLTCP